MRFDDSIRTALAYADSRGAGARAAAFQQLVDLLAQGRGQTEPSLRDRAFDVLENLRSDVSRNVRQMMARVVARAGADLRMVRFFLDEPIGDIAELLLTARLDEAEWLELVPELPAPARALVRERRDLPNSVRRALAALGPAEVLLPGSESKPRPPSEGRDRVQQASEPSVEADPGLHRDDEREGAGMPASGDPAITESERQVRALLNEIAAFRSVYDAQKQALKADPVPAAIVLVGDWRWEIDDCGCFMFIDGAPKEALIGRALIDLDVKSRAPLELALRRRAPFREILVDLRGDEVLRGVWSLSGVPFFDPRDGRYQGFRGTATRVADHHSRQAPRRHSHGGLFGTGASSDTLSQMAHEVRTPLNAIMGFAEMIEKEVLGPAPAEYRRRAGAIVDSATHLLGALDDLTDAARLDQGQYRVEIEEFDICALIEEVCERYHAMAQERGAMLVKTVAAGMPRIWGDARSTDRALSRLLAAVLAAVTPGETLLLGAQAAAQDHIRIFLSRPARLAELSVEALFDPGVMTVEDGETPPSVVGIGFGLRLVQQLATALGGSFDIEPRLFILLLPPFGKAAGGTRKAS